MFDPPRFPAIGNQEFAFNKRTALDCNVQLVWLNGHDTCCIIEEDTNSGVFNESTISN